jgi:hypothetical protein
LFVLDFLERGNASPGVLGATVQGSRRPVLMVPVSPHPERRLESLLHNQRPLLLPWGRISRPNHRRVSLDSFSAPRNHLWRFTIPQMEAQMVGRSGKAYQSALRRN